MSFLSVLKAIGHGVEVGLSDASKPAVVSLVSAIPVFGPEASLVLKAISTVETLVPISGAGAAKKVAVTALVTAAVPELAATPAAQATLSESIDSIVSGMNALETALTALQGTQNPPTT